jgi:predicted PurR-regulated permease PerM
MNRIKPDQIILLLIVLFISAMFLAMIRYFFMAIVLAAIFSALAAPINNRFIKWLRGSKSLSAAMTMFTMLVMLILPLTLLIGAVLQQAVKISRFVVPLVRQQLEDPAALDRHLRSVPFYSELELYRAEILQKAGDVAGKTGSILFDTLSSFTFSAINDLLLLFVFLYTMFFLIRDGRQLLERVLSYLPLSVTDSHRLLDKFLSVTRATLKGCIALGILQGMLSGLAFHFAGIDNAIFWGAVMSVLLMFPILGPPLTWIFVWVPAIIYLVVTGQHLQAVSVFLFLSLIVHPIDNIVRPILVGRDTQLHELLIFFGTLGGIGMFGIFGIFVGPIISALFMTVWEMYGETFGGYLADIKQGRSDV